MGIDWEISQMDGYRGGENQFGPGIVDRADFVWLNDAVEPRFAQDGKVRRDLR